MDYELNRTWVEIDLDCINHNVNQFKLLTNYKPIIMAVVKADAYGHGAVAISKALIQSGVGYLAVTSIDEAIQLRNNNILAPILVLNYTEPLRSGEIIKYNTVQTIFDLNAAKHLSDLAVKNSKTVKIHIKLDTGMTRVGYNTDINSLNEILNISKLPGIEIEGIFTHFASADEKDSSYTLMQFDFFMSVLKTLSDNGLNIPIKHVANSAATIQYPDMHLDMVRVGISLYGLYPSEEVDKSLIDLKPAMTFKTKIIRVNKVAAGKSISYGRIFTTSRSSTIATVPVGYADGYTRLLTQKGQVLINGQRAPIVGKICMDQLMVDVSDITGNISVGDHVVLFGNQNGSILHIDEVAKTLGTINYEIICMVGKRIPRLYYKCGKLTDVYNLITN